MYEVHYNLMNFSNIKFAWVFAVFSHLTIIPYSFSIQSLFNSWPRNSFSWSLVIIVGLWYLHNHVFSTTVSMLATCLSFYRTISNHQVAGSIIVSYFSMRGSSWPSLKILYRPIRSTNNMYHGMTSASLSSKLPYFKLF